VDKLYRMLEDENNSKELLKIPEDSYQEIAAYIKTIRADSSDKEKTLDSELSMAERKILSDIAGRLIDLRIQKFNRDPDTDITNLTPVERYIIEPLVQSRKRFERIRESIFNGQVGELVHLSESVKQKYVFARFLHPYAAISGIDLATYGPFEPEDVAILPLENAKSLLKNGIIARNWIELDEQR
jgi:DNA replication initiation complex subunit (GINS family)